VARATGSALDSNLRILDAKGRALVENDDARDRFVHADSRIDNWAAPAAGRYFVEVRDLHERGGPEFVYFLQLTRAESGFGLELDTDKTLLTPGTAGVIFARVTRHNGFAGEVQLAVKGLPPGVTATCGRVLADGRDAGHVAGWPAASVISAALSGSGSTPSPATVIHASVLIGSTSDTEPTKVVLPTPKPPATTIFAEMVNEEVSSG